MATGASTADLAVVLVDARKGLLTQTRRHSYIVSLLGIRHVLLAVNKMDLVDYDEQVFDDIRSEEHTSELQSLMRISYAVFCLKKKNKTIELQIQTYQYK